MSLSDGDKVKRLIRVCRQEGMEEGTGLRKEGQDVRVKAGIG